MTSFAGGQIFLKQKHIMKKTEVPIFRLEFDTEFREKFEDGCREIFDNGILTNGQKVQEFEEKFAAFMAVGNALTVNSGTGAIEIALRALDVRGKKVIIPTNTFIATAAAVENAGAEILPLDVENESFGLSPEALRKNLSSEIGGVIIVHVGGIISRYVFEIREMCEQFGVPLIEDACHAHGSQYKGRKAGTFGTAGCFSFFPTKVMTCGEGGMVITEDVDLYERMLSIRQFGMDLEDKDLHVRPGSNFKMTEFQALLGILDLERLPRRLERRRILARVYEDHLADSHWQVIQPPTGEQCSFYKQIVITPFRRQRVRDYCASKGISLTGEVYRYPLHQQPLHARFKENSSYPVADGFCPWHICPPLYPELSEEEIVFVCTTLKEMDR